jgi:phosphoglucosamine mutase
VARHYFGTDGVRGVFGRDLTPDLVERLGKAATLWAGPGRVLVGRDTRASGPELESALTRGVTSAGGTAVLAGVLPTPAVALLAEDLGAVVSASHNPPEYNGVKLFDRDGQKLTDAQEEEIEALFDAPASGGGSTESRPDAGEQYLRHVLDSFGHDLSGLRVAVDSANGAFSALAPRAFAELGAEVVPVATTPDGSNINRGCGATDLSLVSSVVRDRGLDLGVGFDGDGDRMLAVDERGETLDGDEILAILAPALEVDLVVVTVMTNMGFHRLMEERGIRVVTTPVGDRYVLEALREHGGLLGGEQSGHVIWLRDHVTGDGLVAALLLCRALAGRSLSEAAAAMLRFPQVKENLPVATRELPQALLDEVERVTDELDGRGRVLVRPSGTEPVLRVLAEAETVAEAGEICARIARLVAQELG